MPYIEESSYQSPRLYRNGHVSTIYSSVFHRQNPPSYQREQWELPDGDFLLVDIQKGSPEKTVILCHGLEGSSQSAYTNRAAQFYHGEGFAVFSWNNRSCGGKMNRLPKLYHHGEIEDLAFVVQQVLNRGFSKVYLVGFSMGGAQIMNYFGKKDIDHRVKGGAAISTPIQLKSSALRMEKGLSKVYLKRFLSRIRQKVNKKAELYPDLLNLEKAQEIERFADLAAHYIVPIYGYSDLDDFFTKASPAYAMEGIKTPVLLLNAWDDPIIGSAGFPVDFTQNNKYVHLETPAHGGHCAFPLWGKKYSYAETRTLQFLERL